MMKTMADGKQGLGFIIVYICYLLNSARGANIPPVLDIQNRVLINAESTKIGTVLTKLTAKDSDGPRDLVFSIGDQATGRLVSLDQAVKKSEHEWTVDVILKEQLDRDFQPATRHLLFQVTDGTYKIPVTYTLIITDDNDETPLFLNLPHTLILSELTPVGTAVYQVNTTDADSGKGGIVTYTLQLVNGNEDNPFKIDNQTGSISLAGELDFEQRISYICNITAQDGGGLTNTSTLMVTVTDAQDTPPVFERPSYTVHISENIHVGQPVVTVKAKDGDSAKPNNVFMNLESGPCSDMFILDSKSGEITVKSKLDRESNMLENNNGVCMLNITAIEDNGNRLQYGQLVSWVMVMVFVDDVNDNHPTFNVGKVHATTGRHVTEGAPVVFKQPEMVTVYDSDRGPNGVMDIYLSTIGGHHDTMFQVSPQKAYSQAQIYLKVQNTSALRDYPYNILTIEVTRRDALLLHVNALPKHLSEKG